MQQSVQRTFRCLTRRFHIAALIAVVAAAFSPQAAISSVVTFEQISPNPTSYVLNTDFSVFTLSGIGNVTASVQAVPNLGCDGGATGDFGGFTAGSVALIARGFCEFRVKVQNAFNAGAVAALAGR